MRGLGIEFWLSCLENGVLEKALPMASEVVGALGSSSPLVRGQAGEPSDQSLDCHLDCLTLQAC
jgi:hypothetical protein